MGREVVSFTLGALPRDLNPNRARRLHWGMRHRAAKALREEAHIESMRAQRHVCTLDQYPQKWEKATARVVCYFRTRHRRDPDNIAASLKACWDGCVDSGLLADDSGLAVLPIEIITGAESDRVVVEVRKGVPR